MDTNMVGWFEIPVNDMARAQKFYEQVFDIKIHIVEMGETTMGWFPFPKDPAARGAGGSLIQNPAHYNPSDNGVLIYFSSAEITAELNRVEPAGGQVLQEKTKISDDIGYMALFLDCEGNRIALHCRP